MNKIVGIDLGTSTSEIAYIKEGKVIIIPNDLGELITPSVVNIDNKGNILVGNKALDKLLLEPNQTFIETKRLIGSKTILKSLNKEYLPDEILSYIIDYLVKCAEKHLKEKIDNIIITVPAYFSDIQRRHIIESGKLAGKNVIRILNEPTSAALDYGLDHLDECKNILVYDLGGGTLDITVLQLFEGVIDVKSSFGNNKLGGKDFDEALINYIINDFIKKNKCDIKSDILAFMKLKKAVLECKIALSNESNYEIKIPFFITVANKPLSLEMIITRDLFNSLIKDMILSTLNNVNQALNDAKLTKEDIDLVLLVGGSTKIPLVEEILKEQFGEKIKRVVDPDLTVVKGAAIESMILNKELAHGVNLIVSDVCPYTLGISCLTENDLGVRYTITDPIIERNTTIPTTKKRIYSTVYDKQKAVNIKIYQGEQINPKKNNFLGEYTIDGIPPNKALDESVEISFSYDVNGILEVNTTILSTKKSKKLEININDQELTEEIDFSNWQMSALAKKYKTIINKAEKIINNSLLPQPDLEDIIIELKIAIIDENVEAAISYKDELLEEIDDIANKEKDVMDKVIQNINEGIKQ